MIVYVLFFMVSSMVIYAPTASAIEGHGAWRDEQDIDDGEEFFDKNDIEKAKHEDNLRKKKALKKKRDVQGRSYRRRYSK